MNYIWKYKTPEGFADMCMRSDGDVLTGLWFVGSRDERKHELDGEEKLLPVFAETVKWLDLYFDGQDPGFTPAYRLDNLTDFRREVVEIMCRIPYWKTITYGDIAREIAEKHGLKSMSAQAVGGAVGWNPICIVVPCHRVMGASGALTGYGGGIENKRALLQVEGISFRE